MDKINGAEAQSDRSDIKHRTVTWGFAAAADVPQFGHMTGNSTTRGALLSYGFQKAVADAFTDWAEHNDVDMQQITDHGSATGICDDADIRIFFGAIPGGTTGYLFHPTSRGPIIGGDILLETLDRFKTDQQYLARTVQKALTHALARIGSRSDQVGAMEPDKVSSGVDSATGDLKFRSRRTTADLSASADPRNTHLVDGDRQNEIAAPADVRMIARSAEESPDVDTDLLQCGGGVDMFVFTDSRGTDKKRESSAGNAVG